MFRWEPEGRYRHRIFTAVAPFWFSTAHLWMLIAPFWLVFIFTWSVESQGALSLFKDVPLRTRRAVSPYNFYSSSALLVLNGTSLNSDSGLLARVYIHIVSWEPGGRYHYSKMFHWEPEGRYRHIIFTAVVPFWFSTAHLWIVIAAFWHVFISISSVESQGDAITIQRCSIENQKGAIAIEFLQQ